MLPIDNESYIHVMVIVFLRWFVLSNFCLMVITPYFRVL
jgi:hypothetical protein